MKKVSIFSLLAILICSAFTIDISFKSVDVPLAKGPAFLDQKTPWADSVLNSLTNDEKIAQLFMVAAYSNRGIEHVNEIKSLVKNQKIGGLIFFQGGPGRQIKLTNEYQKLAKTPLMISIDGEWGLAMRLDSTMAFPKQMTLGAIQDNSLIERMGTEIANQCKRVGIHVNLAPVIDINNNPNNPVIGNRSFGGDKRNVAAKGVAYVKGMEKVNVMSNAKHFPGHGDTDADSHKSLPIIEHSKERLTKTELYPFRDLIDNGLSSMMVAHLYIPQLDSTPNRASTLSPKIVNGLLKEEMGFEGLVFTDALNMKGVSKYYKPGEVDVKALIAGNDVLLFAEDVPLAIQKIKEAIAKGEITQEEINKRCHKILKAKEWVGANNFKPISTKNLKETLHSEKAYALKRELVENAITLLDNKNDIIPLKRLDTLKIGILNVGGKENDIFTKRCKDYANIERVVVLSKKPTEEELTKAKDKLVDCNLIVANLNGFNNSKKENYGIPAQAVKAVRAFTKEKKVIVNVLANVYALNKLYGLRYAQASIMAYSNYNMNADYSAQLIFGGISAKGKLPVNIAKRYKIGQGVDTEKTRFKYSKPENVGMNSEILNRIDKIANNGIKERAYPGCQVLVARKGEIIFSKSYGHHDFSKKRAVKNSDIYDLASVTKIAATTASVMKLQGDSIMSIDNKLGSYLPELVGGTQYNNVNIRHMMAHQAGFYPWLPFYVKTLKNKKPNPAIYSKVRTDEFSNRTAEGMYIKPAWRDSILTRITRQNLSSRKKYKYSDMGFYLLQEIIENKMNTTLDSFVYNNFYNQLGTSTMAFKPRDRYPLSRIIPTEKDTVFRKQQIHGDVHDQGSAMLGGVAGHAGLFSNANDLAKMMQMFLNWGEYGGERYLKQDVVKDFTRIQFESNNNRRGAGFDKPVRGGTSGPTCNCVSYTSFGHTGYTGITSWADPDKEIVYIFLSNRFNPYVSSKILKLNIRTDIQQIIYNSIED